VPTVLFYISGHGFGHASREVEIIHALAAVRPDLRILIRSAVNPALLARTLQVPFELRSGPCDTGIIQVSSIEQDDAATIVEAVRFYAEYDAHINAEIQALSSDRISLVVGDIAPMAFEVATRLDVPGIAISNFTWDWIYETHPGLSDAAPWLVPKLRESYAKATVALELPFAGGFDVFRRVERLPLVARRPTRTRADTRAHFGLAPDRPTALLSFGGYGLPNLDFPALDCLRDWTVVTTDRIAAPAETLPAQVRSIAEESFRSSGFRYEDLVGAVDVVLTKPGYGITAECISTGTAMLYTSRGDFREYDVLTAALPRYVRSRFISNEDLLAGRWAASLSALMARAAPAESMATDGADHAARAISARLDASRSG
jgi:hypothetical protein